jgi:hypothetical protein
MTDLRSELVKTIDAVIDRYWDDLPLDVIALKTEAHYLRVLQRGVRDLYNRKIDENGLLDVMIRLLDEQLRKAWNEGMRINGLNPQTDMTDEWEQQLQVIITQEFDYVGKFISEIVIARENGDPMDPFIQRAELWANRYNEVVNAAVLATAEPKDKLEWVLGETEEHCETCAALDGIVASAKDWQASGFHPQEPPNPMLICQGWHCQCELRPTDKRRTWGALAKLLDLAASRVVSP